MLDVRERPEFVERALLVGLYQEKSEEPEGTSLLLELGELVTTLGIDVKGSTLVRVPQFNARLLIGSGKLEEIMNQAEDLDADCIVFDNELSPAQQRNLEAETKLCVVDRQEVILDIFARRAQTREAKLQVSLARMQWSLPRLTRAWTHLGRQGGSGGAARGEGEQQIELDRRIVRRRITQMKAELVEVRKHRATQRKVRSRIPIPNSAIVGYTNAGKSSLLRRLTHADVLVADKLFATLDTTTRKVELPNGNPLLLTDTVGFVRNLPHKLVEAFKATLEEAVLSEFLIHVLDAGQPRAQEFYETTLSVLKELGADQKRIITVFNKVDTVEDRAILPALKALDPECVFISVHTGEGLEELYTRMQDMISDRVVQMDMSIPHDRSDLIALLHKHGQVIESKYEYETVELTASFPRRIQEKFAAFERHGTTQTS
jgi:GTP-binding protein HflX